MPKFTKSDDQGTTNGRRTGKPSVLSTANDGESESELLTPEEWVEFAEAYRLSSRELEVLILTLRDQPRKVIARTLRISFDTVNKYCDRLHKKTCAMGRVALMRRLVEFVRTVNPT